MTDGIDEDTRLKLITDDMQKSERWYDLPRDEREKEVLAAAREYCARYSDGVFPSQDVAEDFRAGRRDGNPLMQVAVAVVRAERIFATLESAKMRTARNHAKIRLRHAREDLKAALSDFDALDAPRLIRVVNALEDTADARAQMLMDASVEITNEQAPSFHPDTGTLSPPSNIPDVRLAQNAYRMYTALKHCIIERDEWLDEARAVIATIETPPWKR